MNEICDCCLKEKSNVSVQTIGPALSFNICEECAEEMKKPATPARRWLEQKRREA
jgi:hypothetical protein